MQEYIKEFTSDKAWGEGGYLSDAGLIPMPQEERDKYASEARSLSNNIALAAASSY